MPEALEAHAPEPRSVTTQGVSGEPSCSSRNVKNDTNSSRHGATSSGPNSNQ